MGACPRPGTSSYTRGPKRDHGPASSLRTGARGGSAAGRCFLGWTRAGDRPLRPHTDCVCTRRSHRCSVRGAERCTWAPPSRLVTAHASKARSSGSATHCQHIRDGGGAGREHAHFCELHRCGTHEGGIHMRAARLVCTAPPPHGHMPFSRESPWEVATSRSCISRRRACGG